MAIVDIYGKPIQPAQLRQPQSAALQHLRRTFANHPARGLTPVKLHTILTRAEEGDIEAQHELFMDMEERDGHIAAEMYKRKMAVVGLEWTLKPPRDAAAREKKAAANLEAFLRDELDIEALLFDLLDGIGHGFAALEYTWERPADRWIPRPEQRPQTWFQFDPEDRNTLRLRTQLDAYGSPLQPFGWLTHIHRARSGYVPRIGLHRTLAWPYLFKNYSVRDLAEFLEIYGLPIRIGKYPVTADEEAKATLLNAVVELGHHAAGIIPDSMMVELVQASASGSADSFKVLIDWCEATQSKAIVGATLTSQTGANGNRSLGDIHNEVRLDIRNSDATQLAASLSSYLVYPVAVLNGFAAPNRVPMWGFDTQEPEDLKLFAESLPKLVAVGARIPERYVHDKLKIPAPEGDEPVLQAPSAASAPVDPSPAAARAGVKSHCPACHGLNAAAAKAPIPNDPLDDLRQLALDGWRTQMNPLVEELNAALDAAIERGDSAEAFAAALAQLADNADPARLVEALTNASFMARLAGQAGVDINASGSQS